MLDSKSIAFVNGKPTDILSVYDRGLQFGDGIYETITCKNGEIEYLEHHFARLRAGCSLLKLPFPDFDQIENQLEQLSSDQSVVLKIIYTRGVADRGYSPPATVKPTLILYAYPWKVIAPDLYKKGVDLTICDQRLPEYGHLADVKHLNRLPQVLASCEIKAAGSFDGLMLNHASQVIECTTSNLFYVLDGKLYTPPVKGFGLPGTIRHELVDKGVAMERSITLDQFSLVSEFFCTNSVIGVLPVKSISSYQFDITGRVFELLEKLKLERP